MECNYEQAKDALELRSNFSLLSNTKTILELYEKLGNSKQGKEQCLISHLLHVF